MSDCVRHQWKQCMVPLTYRELPDVYLSYYCTQCGRNDTMKSGGSEEKRWIENQIRSGVTTVQRLA